MNNRNVLITGQIGSGKTTLAKVLLAMTPRAIVLDPVADYAPNYGYVTDRFDEAVDAYMESRDGAMVLVYRGERAEHYRYMLRLIELAQRQNPKHGPIALFLEESSYYSTLHDIYPELRRVYELGRRWQINCVSIIQRDTSINPTIRMNTQIWVSMQQIKLSSDYKDLFDADLVRSLERLTPEMSPVQGKHFLVVPDNVNLFDEWSRINAAKSR